MAWGGDLGRTMNCQGKLTEETYGRDPVHVTDLQATLPHLLGIDHERFTYKHQALDQKLTGVEHPTRVVKEILA